MSNTALLSIIENKHLSSCELLKEIERRPVVFLGNPSIFNLSVFLTGYVSACVNHEKIMVENEDFWFGFRKWIENRYRKFCDADIKSIEFMMFIIAGGDEYMAFNEYFNNFHQYLQDVDSNGYYVEKIENRHLNTPLKPALMKRNHMDIYELLKEIEKRPSLFLSTPSIFRLSAYLHGYFTAYSNYGIISQDREIFSEFTEWISSKYSKLKIADIYRWEQVIFIVSCGDEYEALKDFFKFFQIYLQGRDA